MKILGTFLIGMLLPFLSGHSEDTAKKWWDHELDFDTLPSHQDPAWSERGKGGLVSLEDGKLVISTMDTEQSIAFVLDEPEIHDAITVEFRVRAKEILARFGAQFNVNCNGAVYVIPITNTEETTYRLVLDNNIMTLYRNGEDASIVKPAPETRYKDAPNRLLFGDASSAAIGTTEWSKLRWTWGKAIHEK